MRSILAWVIACPSLVLLSNLGSAQAHLVSKPWSMGNTKAQTALPPTGSVLTLGSSLLTGEYEPWTKIPLANPWGTLINVLKPRALLDHVAIGGDDDDGLEVQRALSRISPNAVNASCCW